MKKPALPIIALISCLAGSFGAYAMDRPVGYSTASGAPGSAVLGDESTTAASLATHKPRYEDPFTKKTVPKVLAATPAPKKFVTHFLITGDRTKVPFDPEILKNQSRFIKTAVDFSEGFEEGTEEKKEIHLHPKLFPTKHTVKIIVKILYNLAGYAWQEDGLGKEETKDVTTPKAAGLLKKINAQPIEQQAAYLGADSLSELLGEIKPYSLPDYLPLKYANPTTAKMLNKRFIRQIKHVLRLEGHTGLVYSVAFSPYGTKVVSGSEDNTIKIWDAITGICTKTLTGHTSRVISAAFSPDGTQIVSGSSDKSIKIWNATTGECTKTLEGYRDEIWSVAFSPGGTKVVSGSRDSSIKIWNATTGECQHTLTDTNLVCSVAFSPDGTQVVSGSEDDSIKIWDVTTGKCTKTLTGHTGSVKSVAFSPDGTQIVSGSNDKSIKIWDAKTGECKNTLTGHTGKVYSVAFSPDGEQIVSCSCYGIKIWDTKTGECIKTLEGHIHWVNSVAFSPYGTKVVSCSYENTIRIWNVAPLTLDQLAAYTFLKNALTETAKTPGIQKLRLKSFVKDMYPLVREACGCLERIDPKKVPAVWKLLRKIRPLLREVGEERKFGYAEA